MAVNFIATCGAPNRCDLLDPNLAVEVAMGLFYMKKNRTRSSLKSPFAQIVQNIIYVCDQ